MLQCGVVATTGCPAGQYNASGSSGCLTCQANTYAFAQATTCTTCQAGSRSTAGSRTCTVSTASHAYFDGPRYMPTATPGMKTYMIGWRPGFPSHVRNTLVGGQAGRQLACFDVDGDGDTDAFYIDAGHVVDYYENIGSTPTNQIYVKRNGTANPLNGVVARDLFCFDMDFDGDTGYRNTPRRLDCGVGSKSVQ